jgi:hypothetical protein
LGDTVGLFVGAPGPSHAAGVAEARTHYLTPEAKGKDVVIANTYAKVPETVVDTLEAQFNRPLNLCDNRK